MFLIGAIKLNVEKKFNTCYSLTLIDIQGGPKKS